jgi:RNA polymerase subunit RPABC4/transcription elongation factor Spt4
MARIGHFCHECGDELPEGAETCPAHPDAPVDSIAVDD